MWDLLTTIGNILFALFCWGAVIGIILLFSTKADSKQQPVTNSLSDNNPRYDDDLGMTHYILMIVYT